MKSLYIVGTRAAGKTTVANALLGAVMFPAFAGRVTPLNVTFKNVVNADDLRAHACLVAACTAEGLQLCDIASFAEVSRLGTAACAVTVPPHATGIVVSAVTPLADNNVDVVEAAAGTSIPELAAIIAVITAEDIRQARHRNDMSFGLSPCDVGRVVQSGIVIVNVHGPADASELSRLRSMTSTLLGLEAQRVFAFDARVALAQTLVPGLGAPQCIHDVRECVLKQWRLQAPMTAKYKIETSGMFAAAAADQAPDRYVPKHLAHRFTPSEARSVPKCLLPSPRHSDEERYVPKALQSVRIAADLVAGLNSYAPKATVAAA